MIKAGWMRKERPMAGKCNCDCQMERMAKLEAALRKIRAGKWTESGDAQGAAWSELRAMKIAEQALKDAPNA